MDVSAVTGHARLSYGHAEEIFRAASDGWTLHQLRHSAITHLAEGNVGLALLMAKNVAAQLRAAADTAPPDATS